MKAQLSKKAQAFHLEPDVTDALRDCDKRAEAESAKDAERKAAECQQIIRSVNGSFWLAVARIAVTVRRLFDGPVTSFRECAGV